MDQRAPELVRREFGKKRLRQLEALFLRVSRATA